MGFFYLELRWILFGQLLEKLGYFNLNIWSRWSVGVMRTRPRSRVPPVFFDPVKTMHSGDSLY